MKVKFISKLSIIFTMSTVLVNAMQESIKKEQASDMLTLTSGEKDLKISKSRWHGSDLITTATNAPGYNKEKKIILDKESVKLGSLVDSWLRIEKKGSKETENFLQKLSTCKHAELLAGLQRFGFVDKLMNGDFNNIEKSLSKKMKDWLISEVNEKFPTWPKKREYLEENTPLSEEGNEIIENILQNLIRPLTLNERGNFFRDDGRLKSIKLNKKFNSGYHQFLTILPIYSEMNIHNKVRRKIDGYRIIDPKTDEVLLLLSKNTHFDEFNKNLITIIKDKKKEVINLDNEREKRKITFSRLKPAQLFLIFGLKNGLLYGNLKKYTSLWEGLDQNVRKNLWGLYLTAEQVASLEGIKTNLDIE